MRSLNNQKALTFYQWASFISMLGSQMQSFASSMELTYRVENLPVSIALAISFLLSSWPSIVFPLLGGRLGDYFSRSTVVLGAQVLFIVHSLLLWQLHTEVLALYILGATSSVIGALSAPARGALVQDLAGGRTLHKALATNTAFLNIAWIIGTLISSVVVFQADRVWLLYLVDAASFLPMIVLMGILRKRIRRSTSKVTHASLRDAITYLAEQTGVRRVLMCTAVLALGAGGGDIAQRVLAVEVFANLQTFTWFTVANSVGALITALIVNRIKEPTFRWVLGTAAMALLFLAAQGVSRGLAPTILFVFVQCGAYLACVQLAAPLTYVGPERLRERIIGLVQALEMTCTAGSYLLVGLLTPLIGVQAVLVLMGLGGFFALCLYWGATSAFRRRLTAHLIVARMILGIIWWAILTRWKGKWSL